MNIGNIDIGVALDKDKFDKSVKGLQGSLGSMGSKAKKMGISFTKNVALPLAAGGVAAFAFSKKMAGSLDDIDKMSSRLGMSAEAFQEWDFILSQSGVSIDQMQMGMKKMSQMAVDAAEGGVKGSEAFEKLGISVTDSTGKMKGQTELFEETVVQLQGMESGIEKTNLAQELFGRTGQEMLPLLNAQAGGIEELKKKAHELGIIQSGEAIDAGVQFTDTLDQTERMLGSVAKELASNLLPKFNDLLQWVQSNLPTIKRVATDVFNALGTVMSVATNTIGAFIEIGKGIAPLFDSMQSASSRATSNILSDARTRKTSLEGELKQTLSVKDEKIAAVNEERKAAITAKNVEIDAAKEVLEEEKTSLKKRLDNVDNFTENSIDAAKESADARIKEIDRELKEFEDAKEEEMKLLDDVYDKQIKLLSKEEQEKIKKIQNEIDGINNITAMEEEEIKKRKETEKISNLKSEIQAAETVEEKKKLEKELSDFKAELAREELLNSREDRISELEAEISSTEEEYDAKEEIMKNQYDTAKSILDQSVVDKRAAAEEEKTMQQEKLAQLEKNLKSSAANQKSIITQQMKDVDVEMDNLNSSMTKGLNEPFDAAIEKIDNEFAPRMEQLVKDIKKASDDITDAEDKLEEIEDKKAEDALDFIKKKEEESSGIFGIGVSDKSLEKYNQRANGGHVTKGSSYITGEREPELFTAEQSGRITPMSDLAGAGGINININKMQVRNDNDIKRVSRELFNMVTSTNRGSGR